MTWSIVARDPTTGAFAVAVTTCNLAVGASCPFLRTGVGAVSTQSMSNRYLGPAVLDALARGLPADLALRSALAGDEGEGLRQIHVVDAQGRVAAHTGANCVEWCGSIAGENFSVAGNMLANGQVVADSAAVFARRSDLPLPERLMEALHAGQAAGGDRRGKQSAALMLTTTEDFPDINLRVDDHPEPLEELSRLLALWRVQAEPSQHTRPSRANPAGLIDLDAIEAGWHARGMDLRFRR
ncbi:DUF1028 domain-containing protein [Roseomonas sp. HJA6]|uniref:DUF1028 domain-containing protein n=1 Tax=Roseomonas alba TaxID=2846776 RepID=A0ABS7ABW3_9PROT|nr:DUF1028 domain-containing protein [Neoroseomonas alba]MBW6399570.1 DUF1028 domain-containing protein [Neoroseomonas alba]